MPGISARANPQSTLLKRLSSPRMDAKKIAFTIVEKPRLIAAVVGCLNSSNPNLKYGAAKVVKLVSESSPRLLYSHFDQFVRLLDSDNAFLRWDALHVLANLAPVDYQEKLSAILDRYLEPITEHELIAAANCTHGASRIAVAKPHLADMIAHEILKVEHGIYKTPECRDIAIGHAITAFDQFFREIVEERFEVLEFVKHQQHNPRRATRKKADLFLKRWAA